MERLRMNKNAILAQKIHQPSIGSPEMINPHGSINEN
jgi:hypothetical protein